MSPILSSPVRPETPSPTPTPPPPEQPTKPPVENPTTPPSETPPLILPDPETVPGRQMPPPQARMG